MTDELNQGFAAEELGLQPEEVAPVAADGTVAAPISDELRNSILLEAIQSGQMVPASYLDQQSPTQPQAYEQPRVPASDDEDDDSSLVFQGDFKRRLAEERARVAQEVRAQMDAVYGPALANLQAQSIAQEVAEVMPEAAAIARQLVSQMGAGAVQMNPEVRALIKDAAIGRAVVEQRGRQVPTHEAPGSSAPRYQIADGYDMDSIAMFRSNFETIYKRPPTAAELKAEGLIR